MKVNIAVHTMPVQNGQVRGMDASGKRQGMRANQDKQLQNIQNQIDHLQERMHGLSDNQELSLTEKMELRKELREQMQELRKQFTSRQIELRKEEQEKRAKKMQEQTEQLSPDKADKNQRNEENTKQIVALDNVAGQLDVEHSVKVEISGLARTLAGEIRMDKERGSSVEGKKSALESLEEKIENLDKEMMSKIDDIQDIQKEASKTQEEEKEMGSDITEDKLAEGAKKNDKTGETA
ncbi:MAG: FlxA-like family protein [Lachnospiraceae bacterium]|nr:FlxA-like family protein [Lachnospiraceae bacterium]